MIKEQARQILQHYGILHQKAKTIEELAELIVVLQKDILEGKEEHSRAVLEEIADVNIMLTQLLDDEGDKTTVSLIVDKKLKRQIMRIKAGTNSGKTCGTCAWYIILRPLARKGVCYCSKSDKYRNYVNDKMTCQKWEE
nr:MAG TPA: nucleoside triphosphate pyrophosphohydrolase [Caudoviricetes sp.]